GDGGVVEQHVDAALGLRGVVSEALRGRGIVDVRNDRVGLAAVSADLLHRLVRARPIDVGHHDASTLASEQERARAADAGTAPGDDADLSLETSCAHSAGNPPATGSATPLMKPAAAVARTSPTA